MRISGLFCMGRRKHASGELEKFTWNLHTDYGAELDGAWEILYVEGVKKKREKK